MPVAKKMAPSIKVGNRAKKRRPKAPHVPNPRRVEAGRRNWAKRKGFTPEGLARLREAALRNKPWKHSTGPKTAAGKAIVGRNWRRGNGFGALLAEIRKLRCALVDPAVQMRLSIQENLAGDEL